MSPWVPYNYGPANLEFFNRDGTPFTGEMNEFFTIHGSLMGLKNKYTGMIILINSHGEIAAKGHE